MTESAPKRRKVNHSSLKESLKVTEAWTAVPNEDRVPFRGFSTRTINGRQLCYSTIFSAKVFYDRFEDFLEALSVREGPIFWSNCVLNSGVKNAFFEKRREEYFATNEVGKRWKECLDAGLVEKVEWHKATLEQLLENRKKTWTPIAEDGKVPFPVVLVRTDEDGHATQYYATFSCETAAQRFHEFLMTLELSDSDPVGFYNEYVLADDSTWAEEEEVAEFGKAAYCKENEAGICWKKLLDAGLVEDADWHIATAIADPNNAQEAGSERYSWEEMKKFGNARAVFRTTNFS